MNEERCCKICKYFYSYADIYFDELEPYDMGECHSEGTYPVSSDKCGVRWEDSCNEWASIERLEK